MKVFSRPGRACPNPYVCLLADALERQGLEVRDVRLSRWNLPFSRSVLLIHWADELYRPPKNLITLAVAWMWLAHMALARRLAGLKVVWIAHDAIPHNLDPGKPPFRWKWFLSLIDGVISLSHDSRSEVLAIHPSLRGRPWLVTSHGDYSARAIDAPTMPGPVGARPVRIAALGTIRENKRFAQLARVVAASELDVTLDLRGAPDTPELGEELRSIARASPRIALDLNRLSDEEIETGTDAADLIVLPYTGILNSGALFFALSRYRPVVAPRQGSIPEVRDQVGHDWIYLFDGAFDAQVLADALRWLRETPRPAPPDLSSQDWGRIGREIADFLTEVAQGQTMAKLG